MITFFFPFCALNSCQQQLARSHVINTHTALLGNKRVGASSFIGVLRSPRSIDSPSEFDSRGRLDQMPISIPSSSPLTAHEKTHLALPLARPRGGLAEVPGVESVSMSLAVVAVTTLCDLLLTASADVEFTTQHTPLLSLGLW